MNVGVVELALICLIAAITLALVAALVTFYVRNTRREAQRVPCPHCGEMIMPGAKVCRFCGRDLDPTRDLDQRA